jgi:AcrR family transcriptional regulator
MCVKLRGAALEVVGRDGIEALSTERLADQAGVPADEVAAHYPDARDCLHETYEEVSRSIYEDFARAFAAEEGWRRALMLAARTLLERLAARPAEARLCFQEVLRGDHELLRRRDAARRRMVDLFVEELGRRRDAPEQFRMQLEMLIGAEFQAIAMGVAGGDLAELPELHLELESRAFVFEPLAA